MSVPGHLCASLLLLVGMILRNTTPAFGSSSPRLRLSHKELWHLNRTWAFDSPQGPLSPRTMLLDEHEERLFVGGRDGLFSLSLERVNSKHREISWASTAGQVDECLMKGREKAECANYVKVLHQYNRTHLLACGTGAFDPICAFVNVGRWAEDGLFELEASHIMGGRGRCPFDPNSSCTSIFSKGQLYVGLYTDYWENDAALCRHGDASFTRTEQNHRQQLNEPKFVGSVIIPDNDDPDDDKVYFFFMEKAADTEDGNSVVYSRIGRVCANDLGGQRMLVNKWTSFTKARLVCSVPGSDGMNTHFDELVDVFVLKRKDEKKPEIFGLFSTTSNIFKGYAVCVYSMDEVRAAFNGPYAHKERPDHHWAAFQGRIPFPRPGSCASQMNGGQFSSSREYPDEVLRFIRTHPVMFQPVQPVHRRPILIRTDAEQRFTQIAVDRVEAEDGHYDVLFIGTDNSVVLKVITIHNKETNIIEEVVLEELHVFKVPVPITEILISSKRQRLFVGSELGVAQVRVHQCRLYGSACADCCLARDPYCAWDGATCSRYLPAGISMKRRVRRQDVRHGNAIQQCNGMQINGGQLEKPEEKLVYGVEGNGTLLECSPRSLRANVVWLAQRGLDTDKVKVDSRLAQTPHGLLFLQLRRTDSGVYLCQTEERGFIHTVARISLEVLEEERVEELLHQEGEPRGEAQHRTPCPLPGAPHGSTPRLWYKEFLQLIGYSNVHKVEEYCEKVWCSNRGRKKLKSLNSKWKLSQAQERRGRTRVDHQRSPRHAPAT